MLNISKKRKWKTYDKRDDTDIYYPYHLSKKQRGEYLNTWFEGQKAGLSKKGIIYRDEMITFKQCDEDTAIHLYHRKFNPVSINIMCPIGAKFNYNASNEPLYNMKFQIHSIDDSSYGIWWDNKSLEELKKIRNQLMIIISWMPVINGELLLNLCIDFGADKESKDYN